MAASKLLVSQRALLARIDILREVHEDDLSDGAKWLFDRVRKATVGEIRMIEEGAS